MIVKPPQPQGEFRHDPKSNGQIRAEDSGKPAAIELADARYALAQVSLQRPFPAHDLRWIDPFGIRIAATFELLIQ
jgi:hypothetical protein